MKAHALIAIVLLAAPFAFAQDASEADATVNDAATDTETTEAQPAATGIAPDQPRTMSGMSILGNEEAPKALVIVPWKTSEMGDELSLSENLDDQATPVDKEVFLRELAYYEVRTSTTP
jgi:hypothetical protein